MLKPKRWVIMRQYGEVIDAMCEAVRAAHAALIAHREADWPIQEQ
jgi:hypothetical protein